MRHRETGEPRDSHISASRLRAVACCALLAALAFVQSPGLQVSDTKFDLAVTPIEFLRRAFHLWDGSAAFGQLQDQSYGYIVPTGFFFVLGHLADVSPWVTQRLWYSVVLVVAFLGVRAVLRALGVRRDLPVIIAGFAYALSPALLTVLGPISSEAWPMSLTPWVLLPLIRGTQGALPPWRAGLLAGLAVALVGGINAVATAAVLPLGALWLLTRRRNTRQWKILAWWVLFTIAGTSWWAVPLLILGQYSPPFLDFIESADTTTFAGTIVDGLRGTTHWVPYIDGSWQTGHELITLGFLALDAAVVIGLGLIGLSVRRAHGGDERLFLTLGVLVGLFLVTLGHRGEVQGWFASGLNTSLDGVLAAARNVHKFDPVVRLPLVIGLAFAVERALASTRRGVVRLGGKPMAVGLGQGVAAVACLVVVAGALPLLQGKGAPKNEVFETPDYWHEAISWVDDQERGVALMLPGSSFGHYLWGSPDDEPMQYLDSKSWAVRNAVPLTPAGNIRMLDAIEKRLAQGQGSDGLAPYLRRAGVGLLVVRNDLVADGDVPEDALVLQALNNSPGLRVIKGFGPNVGSDVSTSSIDGRLVTNAGWQRHRSAIEVYAVADADEPADLRQDPTMIVGGPEDVLDALEVGVIGEGPTVLASDLDTMAAEDRPATGATVLTDGYLDREQTFGQIHDAQSAVRTPGDVRRTSNRVQDYESSAGSRWRTQVELSGVVAIKASSSASDATALGGARPGNLPFAAVDGNGRSSWRSDPGNTDIAWWQVDLGSDRTLASVDLLLGFGGPQNQTVRVRTAAGLSSPVQLRPGVRTTVPLARGETSWVRVEGIWPGELTLAEVEIPGVRARRSLVVPQLPEGAGAPDAIVLRALGESRTGCVTLRNRVPCLAERARPAEEPAGFERILTLPAGERYHGEVSVKARAGQALTSLLTEGSVAGARSSSDVGDDPRGSVLAALDGRGGTAWTAALDDRQPSVEVHWLGVRTVRTIVAAVGRSAPVRRPTEMRVTWPGGEAKVSLDSSGRGILPEPIETSWVKLTITKSSPTAWVDAFGGWNDLPVGISRLRIEGLSSRLLTLGTDVKDRGCGSGPDVRVDGSVVQTRLVASDAQLYGMKEVPARLCGDVKLAAGQHTITVEATDALTPTRLVLTGPGDLPGTAASDAPARQGSAAGTDAGAELTRTGPVDREIIPLRGQRVVDQRENINSGWVATQGGRRLTPVTLDGWRQGWITDGSTTPVRLHFAPDRGYQIALVAGLGAFVAMLMLAVATFRRRRVRPAAAPVDAASLPWWLCAPAGVGAAGLLAGWPGAAIVAGVWLASTALRQWWTDLTSAAVVMAAMLAVGMAYQARPWAGPQSWAGFEAWPQWVAMAALGLVVAGVARPRLSRTKGRSTTR